MSSTQIGVSDVRQSISESWRGGEGAEVGGWGGGAQKEVGVRACVCVGGRGKGGRAERKYLCDHWKGKVTLG